MKHMGMLFCGLLRRRWGWYLPAALCAFWSFLAYFGLCSIQDTLRQTQRQFEDVCGTADLYVYCENTDAGVLQSALKTVSGVVAADEGLFYEERCTGSDGHLYQIRFLGLRETSVLHPYLTSSVQYAVSFGYSADYGSEHLQTLTRQDGTKLDTSEAAYLSIYTGVYLDRCVPSTDSGFADVYADYNAVCGLAGGESVNFAAVRLSEGADALAVIDAVYALDAITVTDAYTGAEEPAYRASQELCEMVVGVCRVFAPLLCGTGILFALLFLSGAVSRIRRSMTALCADGATVAELFLPMFFCALVSLLCGLFAAIPASYILCRQASAVCLRNMGIFEGPIVFPFDSLCRGMLLAAVVSGVSALIGTVGVVRRTVRSVQKHSVPLFAVKLCDFGAAAICTAASVLMTASTVMFHDSLEAVRDELFSQRCVYDALVIYDGFVSLTELDALTALPEVETAEPLLLGSAELRFQSQRFQAMGLGIVEDSSTICFFDADHLPLHAEENRILLSQAAAEILGAKSGDVLTAEIICKGKRTQISCLAAGVSEQYTTFQEVFSVSTAEQYLDSSGLMNCAAVLLSAGAEEEAAIQAIRGVSQVYTVQSHAQAEERFDRRYAGTLKLIRLIAADGLFLGFSVLLLTAFASYRRNLRRNTVLVMLGAPTAHILIPEFLRRLSGVLFGCFIAVPLCSTVVRRLLEMLSAPSVIYPYVFHPNTYLRCCIPMLACAAMLAVLFTGKVLHIAKDPARI